MLGPAGELPGGADDEPDRFSGSIYPDGSSAFLAVKRQGSHGHEDTEACKSAEMSEVHLISLLWCTNPDCTGMDSWCLSTEFACVVSNPALPGKGEQVHRTKVKTMFT